MMQAHALEESLVLVEVEAVGLPLRPADAEGRFVGVQHLVGGFHGGAGDVHRRAVRGPEAGSLQVEGLPDGLPVHDPFDAAGLGEDAVHDHLLPVALETVLADDPRPDHAHRLLARVLEGDTEGDRGVGLVQDPVDGADFCRDIRAPVGDGGLVRLREPDIPVDAAAGIPAGGFLGIVDMDGDLVPAGFQRRIQADGEGGVAVRPAAEVDAVDLHGRMRHGAVDLEVDVLFQVFRGDFQSFSIVGLAPPGELPAFAGILLLEGPLHAPVVRQVHRPALSVLDEGPAFVEGRPARGLRRGRDGRQRHDEANDQSSHTRD